MAGFKKASTDLDALLEPWQSGDGFAAATGFKIAAADLNTKYAPASVGAGYTGGTNFKQASADIGPRFCAKGARITALPFDGQTFQVESDRSITIATTTYVALTIKSDGTYTVEMHGNDVSFIAASGTWLPGGHAVSDYQVQYVVTTIVDYPSAPASITNDAPAYSACTTSRLVEARTFAGSSSTPEKGGQYQVVIKLKRISTSVVTTTTCVFDVMAVNFEFDN